MNPNWQSPGVRGPQVLNPGLSLRPGNLPSVAQLQPGQAGAAPPAPPILPLPSPRSDPRPRPMPFRQQGGKPSLIAEILRGQGVPRGPSGPSSIGGGVSRMIEAMGPGLQTDQGPSLNEPSLEDAAALGAPGEDTGDAAIWEFALSQPDLLSQAASGGMTSADLLAALRQRRGSRPGLPAGVTPGNPGLL